MYYIFMRGEEEFQEYTDICFPKISLFDLMGTVEEANANFLTESSKYRKFPTQNSLNRLLQAATYQEISLTNAIKYIYFNDSSEYDISEKTKMIHSLLVDDDKERIQYLGSLTTNEAFSPIEISQEEFAESMEELLENEIGEEDIVPLIMTIYHNSCETDITNFVSEVEKTKNAKVMRVGKHMGQLAMDFGKYSAAAAFGAWVASRKMK
jgi:hypothetical protein